MPKTVKQVDRPPEDGADRLWLLNFSIEASARYHEARRVRLETYVAFVKVISIVGAVLAFAFVSGGDTSSESLFIVSISAAVIAFINLLDLVFNFDGRARLHTDLYRRYKALQAKMEQESQEWETHLSDWNAAVRAIEIDEPTVFYALYAIFWNSAVEKYEADGKYLRTIKWWRWRLRHFVHFQPKDF